MTDKLRFKKDDGTDYPKWVDMRLGDCISENSHRNKELKYTEVWSVSNKNGFVKQTDQFDNREVASKDISNYKIIYKNMYAYNPSRINVGSIARSNVDKIGVVSPMYVTFALNELMIADYFDQYIKTFSFQESVKNNTSGSVRDSLNFNALANFKFPLPCLEEQQKIADFFTAIDDKISNIEEQLKEMKDYKKSMLQQIFFLVNHSRERERERRRWLRFKRDDGSEYPDWAMVRLGDVCEILSSKRIFQNEYVLEGIPFYRGKEISELKIHKTVKNPLYISENRYNEIKQQFPIPIKNDILITAVGTIGNSYIIPNNDPFYFKDGNLIWLREIKMNPEFLIFILDNQKSEINDLSSGSSQNALTIEKLKNFQLSLPCLEEQQQIANYLSSIDEKVDNIAHQLDQARDYKKGMLQRVF